MGHALRSALQKLGCKLFAQGSFASSVTAFRTGQVQQLLNLIKTKYKAELSGGQGSLKGKILRVGHLGFVDPLDMVSALTAIEYALKDLGSSHSLGCGVSEYMKVAYELSMNTP